MNIIEKLQSEIVEKQIQIQEIQSKCNHPYIEKKHKSSTGHWDPQDDSYWTECNCLLCKKTWITQGSI